MGKVQRPITISQGKKKREAIKEGLGERQIFSPALSHGQLYVKFSREKLIVAVKVKDKTEVIKHKL